MRLDGPEARNKFGAPMFEPEVFRKQMYCIEESTCDIVGTFRRHSQSFGAPIVIWRPRACGACAPPRYVPAKETISSHWSIAQKPHFSQNTISNTSAGKNLYIDKKS